MTTLLGCLDRFDNTIAGWAFDPALPGTPLDITVEASGREVYRSSANLYRADLLNVTGECDHGFSFDLLDVQPDANESEIQIFAHGTTKTLLGGGFWKSADVAVQGKSNWIFLNVDSNDVNESIAGKKQFPNGQINETALLLATRTAMMRQLGIAYESIIMPEKNVVCAEYRYNAKISEERPAVQVQRLTKKYGADVIYPISHFLDGGPFFHKTDTHANAFGYQLVLSILQQSRPDLFASTIPLEPTFNDTFCGDLGNKFSPPRVETTTEYTFPINDPCFELSDPIPLILQKGETLRGTLVRTTYSKAPNGKAVLFGTSSAYGFLPLLSVYFREVCFIWDYTFDYNLITNLNPDFVLLIISERFLPLSCNDMSGLSNLEEIYKELQ